MNKKFKDYLTEQEELSWKKFHGSLVDDTKIFVVDGNYIRDKLDIHNKKQFINGGHGLVYPDYIPKNEIWVEHMINVQDEKMNLLHEIVEYLKMKYENLSYETAHKASLNIERLIRTLGE